MKYFLISGEASGDLHGAGLIEALKRQDGSDARFVFLGGDRMAAAAGVQPLVHIREMAYMGFSEVLRNLGKIRRNMRLTREALKRIKPDALVLIDYPSFNLRMAREAARLGIPSFYYISPKVWAWKKWRTPKILKLMRRVLCIFPFEPEFYAKEGAAVGQAVYVGNPSVEEVKAQLARSIPHEEFLLKYRLRPNRPLVALMPGSRKGEIRANLPVMAATMDCFTQYKPVIVGAPGIDDSEYAQWLGGREIPVLREESAPEILAHCRGALVTSGTATLEVALCNVPQVALYRSNGSKIAYTLMSKLLHVDFVTLPNLIAGREVIPEMLLHLCTPDAVGERLSGLLRFDADARQRQMDGYAEIRTALGTASAPDTAARIIAAELQKA